MKFQKTQFERIARNSGGLFLGLLFHFPVRIFNGGDEVDAGGDRYWMVTLDVGLIFWRLSFFLSWDHKR